MSSFKWLNKQGVESDSGFIVQRVARFEMEYREGDKVLSLKGEAIFPSGFAVWEGWRTARWNSPNEGVQISPEQRDNIVNNVREASAFMNDRVEFE